MRVTATGRPPERADLRQQHMIEVLLDEIRTAPRQRMHLPMPRDRRLLRIASQLLADPADDRSLAQWAQWAGLSPRTLTRHFRDETTLSFAQWRQQARLAEALRRSAEGDSVADIAHELGFSSPSAFVTVFRRHFGCPPGRYLARAAASPSIHRAAWHPRPHPDNRPPARATAVAVSLPQVTTPHDRSRPPHLPRLRTDPAARVRRARLPRLLDVRGAGPRPAASSATA